MRAYDALMLRRQVDAAALENAKLKQLVNDLVDQLANCEREREQLSLEVQRLKPKAAAVDATIAGVGRVIDDLFGRRASPKRRRS